MLFRSKITNSNIYNIVQSSSFILKMLAPCLVLSEDSLFLRFEDVSFLNIESKIAFLKVLHADHKFLDKSCIMRKLLRRLNQEFLNIIFRYHFFFLNLFLGQFILILDLLKERKRNWMLIFEIYLWPLRISLNIIN